MKRRIGIVEFSDLDMKDFAIQMVKRLYGENIKIESSNYPIRYYKDGDPVYGIRFTQIASSKDDS